jgi:hypothetical protein
MVQSSINVCSGCEVSTWIGKTSPQCGQVISVWEISSILPNATGITDPAYNKFADVGAVAGASLTFLK